MKVRAVAISLLVIGSLFAVVGGATPMAVSPTTGSADASPVVVGAENNTSMGSQVSTFMQSSAGETSESVESGMWDAMFERANGTSAKADVVERRVTRLESRLSTLQSQKQSVMDAYENGTLAEQAYEARMSNLVGRITALNRTISSLAADAESVGADTSTLDSLRETAKNISDSEMNEVAAEMAGGPPKDMPDRAKNASDRGQDGEKNGNGNDGENGNNGNGNDGDTGSDEAGERSNGGGQGNDESDRSRGGDGSADEAENGADNGKESDAGSDSGGAGDGRDGDAGGPDGGENTDGVESDDRTDSERQAPDDPE